MVQVGVLSLMLLCVQLHMHDASAVTQVMTTVCLSQGGTSLQRTALIRDYKHAAALAAEPAQRLVCICVIHSWSISCE
jgi:hypothetical protein